MTTRYVPLAADFDCTRCKGTGCVSALIPTGPLRIGGGPLGGFKIRSLCTCVRAREESTKEPTP